MNLRKDHYRVPPEGGGARLRPVRDGCEKGNEAAVGGEGGRWRLRAARLADARLPLPNARGTTRGTRRRAGEAPESRGGGERPLSGGPPPLRHPRGNPPAGRPSRVPHGPRRPLPGGAEGARKVWKPRARAPLARGAHGRAPGRPRPRRGGAGRPRSAGKDPPLRSAKTCRVPPWRQQRKPTSKEEPKSKTLSGGSLGSRVDEERS